eukprot:m.464288 g.464288  ORF g.464288 m.464288 type:complete len:387 (-) comp23427_c0_seq1:228-1388(-)
MQVRVWFVQVSIRLRHCMAFIVHATQNCLNHITNTFEQENLPRHTTRPTSLPARWHWSDFEPITAFISFMSMESEPLLRDGLKPHSRAEIPKAELQSSPSKFIFTFKNFLLVLLYFGVMMAVYIPTRADWEGAKTVPVLDALYFAVVTVTTVGYGDLTPKTWELKLFMSFFVWISIGLIGIILGEAAGWVLSRQEAMVHQLATDRLNGINDPSVAFRQWEKQHRIRGILALTALLICIVSGTLIFSYMETHGNLIEAFYATSMSVSTVGYGDVAFDTVTGRAVATVWLLCSTMVTASSVGILAAYRAESKQHALVHQKICRKFTQSDFATADMDKDGDIDEFEFVVFKLIEIEMVDPVFVERVRAQFRASGAESLGKTRSRMPPLA